MQVPPNRLQFDILPGIIDCRFEFLYRDETFAHGTAGIARMRHTVQTSVIIPNICAGVTFWIQLFQQHATILSRSRLDKPKDDPFSDLDGIIPFALQFPLETSCSDKGKAIKCPAACLPPSFALRLGCLKARGIYRIRLIAIRSGVLKRKIVKTQNVEFRPLNAPELEPVNPIPTSTHEAAFDDVDVREEYDIRSRYLPAYRPALLLRARMPLPMTLRPGQTIDLAISVVATPDFKIYFGDLWLVNLTIRLKSTIYVRSNAAASQKANWTELCAWKGLIPVQIMHESEGFQLPSAIWAQNIIPDAEPTFCSCGIELAYELEVLARLRAGRSGKVHVSSLLCIDLPQDLLTRMQGCISFAPHTNADALGELIRYLPTLSLHGLMIVARKSCVILNLEERDPGMHVHPAV